MSITRDVAIFFDGTWATNKKSPTSLLGKAASWLMHDDRNFILQLFENCEAEHKYILDGPGTDIVSDSWSPTKFFKTIAAMVDGQIGEAGIGINLTRVKAYLYEHAGTKKENTIILHAFGWSRGGYTVLLLKTVIAELIQEGIKIEVAYFNCIDPVVGGPIDRLRLPFNATQHPNTNLYINIYYSHSGNINLWDTCSQYLPQRYHVNTLFFSAYKDNTTNTNVINFVGDTSYSYKHRINSFIVPANHEGIVGKFIDQKEKLAGDIVLAHILLRSTLQFKHGWSNTAIQKGIQAQTELRKLNVTCKNDRKFLNDSLLSCFIGRNLSEKDNVISILETDLNSQNISELAPTYKPFFN